jgi:hypothetical protein
VELFNWVDLEPCGKGYQVCPEGLSIIRSGTNTWWRSKLRTIGQTPEIELFRGVSEIISISKGISQSKSHPISSCSAYPAILDPIPVAPRWYSLIYAICGAILLSPRPCCGPPLTSNLTREGYILTSFARSGSAGHETSLFHLYFVLTDQSIGASRTW